MKREEGGPKLPNIQEEMTKQKDYDMEYIHFAKG